MHTQGHQAEKQVNQNCLRETFETSSGVLLHIWSCSGRPVLTGATGVVVPADDDDGVIS